MSLSPGRLVLAVTAVVALSAPAGVSASHLASDAEQGKPDGTTPARVVDGHGHSVSVAAAQASAQRASRSQGAQRRAGRGNPRAFAFISKTSPKAPIARWNPCKPIGYRVNARLGGRRALADVKGALRRVRRVNGLRFVYRGPTRIIPGGRGSDRYPKDTQLVISWARPAASDYLRGSGVAGMGGPSWTQWTQGGRTKAMITRGFVVLNANLRLAGGFGSGPDVGLVGTRGQLLMHEIGHAVGLDHPRQNDRWQIMFPTMTDKRAVWGAGDRRGLRGVGSGKGCLRPPSFAPSASASTAAMRY